MSRISDAQQALLKCTHDTHTQEAEHASDISESLMRTHYANFEKQTETRTYRKHGMYPIGLSIHGSAPFRVSANPLWLIKSPTADRFIMSVLAQNTPTCACFPIHLNHAVILPAEYLMHSRPCGSNSSASQSPPADRFNMSVLAQNPTV